MAFEFDPEIVAKIKAQAIADRAVVDNYNAAQLRRVGIEPNETILQAVCEQNIPQAFAAQAKKNQQSK